MVAVVKAKTPSKRAKSDLTDFATRVRQARKLLGLSQQGLSDASKIPTSTLKNYELGHSSPSAENLQKMFKVGINPMWVLLGHKPVLVETLASPTTRHSRALAAAARRDAAGLSTARTQSRAHGKPPIASKRAITTIKREKAPLPTSSTPEVDND
ncbi:helix-turn-helix domain-containing protein [Pseudomonas taiwanensis]|uniref:helix-turn-helix domain-containing protein n=1 Tax=Pseudomonas taiwanensis TaxID=470150 RepID=UPI0028DF976E|nr:helix-turn-helix domain-containing protein [Pseudomonas taiwanensis]MDT8924653.1 helix-turn-helix domain-containing protein [Pseudomonas taiwanensis]